MPVSQPAVGRLENSLDGERIVLLSGERTLAAGQLKRASDDVLHQLIPYRGKRVLLTAPGAEQIIVTLVAACRAGCQVLLCRSMKPGDEQVASWGASAIVAGDVPVSDLQVVAASFNEPQGDFGIFVQTSGTTGEPKMVEHRIESLTGRIRAPHSDAGQVRWLLTYHPATFGGLQVLLTALLTGAQLVTSAGSNIAQLAEAALAHHPTHVSATPTFWRSFLLALGDRAADLQLRQITLGGEISDDSILKRLKQTFPAASLSHIYASTEAGALFSVRDGRAGFPAAWLNDGIDDVKLRIREGVLEVLSPRLMRGYLSENAQPVLTSDGWLSSGDLVEPEGDRVYFRGRADLLLSIGGAKVRPEEVERALLNLPQVEDAVVYGVPNPITGTIIGVDVVLVPSLREDEARAAIVAQLRARLESYKIPRVLRFVPAISLSPSGKKMKWEGTVAQNAKPAEAPLRT